MKKSTNITLSLVTLVAAALTWSCSDHNPNAPAGSTGQTSGTTTAGRPHMLIPVHGGSGASRASGATAGGSSSKGSISRGGFGGSSARVSA
ncbi:MAG: hypothetical protein ABFD69_07920 [Candidatus Sumerlaeia bacterium]